MGWTYGVMGETQITASRARGRVSPESHNIGAKVAYQKPLDYAAHYFSLICANHLPYLYGTRFVLVNRLFNVQSD